MYLEIFIFSKYGGHLVSMLQAAAIRLNISLMSHESLLRHKTR